MVWWWVALYILWLAGCLVIHKDAWWLAIYSMYRLGCIIYRYYRVLLLLYSMNMSWSTIYSVGRVGDMRHSAGLGSAQEWHKQAPSGVGEAAHA